MKKGIEWQLFPKNLSCSKHLMDIIDVFINKVDDIDSTSHQLDSNTVLSCLADDFINLGYAVEKSKKVKIKLKFLFCMVGMENLKNHLMPMPIVLS